MWDEIELPRREDGSLPADVRARLLAKTESDASQAISYILETEMQAVLDARDETKRDSARATFADLERLRELLRVRAYSVEVDRAWDSLPHAERVLMINHLDELGAPPTEDSAKALLSMSITRMAVATVVNSARQSLGRDVAIGEAMMASPITLQMLAIKQAGDYHAAAGQALKLIGVRAKRRWFGR